MPKTHATRIRISALLLLLGSPGFGFEATEAETITFLSADRNKDLVLNFSEFVTFVDAMAKIGHKSSKTVRFFGAYKRAFRVTDANNDGVVSPPELRRADDDFQAGKIPAD